MVADSLADEELDMLSLPISPVRLEDVVAGTVDVGESEPMVESWIGTTGNSESEEAIDPVAERTVEMYSVNIFIIIVARRIVALRTYLVLVVRLGGTALNLF